MKQQILNRVFLIITMYCLTAVYSQRCIAQWEHTLIPEQGWILNVLHTFDTARWVAVGDYGRILTTDDGFRTFKRAKLDTKLDLHGLAFLTASKGITVGAHGITAITSDGGNSWTLRTSGFADTLWSIARVDDFTAVAVGNNGLIIRTTDAGNSWKRIISNSDASLLAVKVRGQTAVAVGRGGAVVQSEDAGITWARIKSGLTADIFTITFSENNTCIAGGDSTFLIRSEDAGRTWSEPYHLYDEYGETDPWNDIYSISFLDANVGFACGRFWLSPFSVHYMRVFHTFDGGKTWYQPLPFRPEGFNDPVQFGYWSALSVIDSNHIAAVGFNPDERLSQALFTDNGGKISWSRRLAKADAPDTENIGINISSTHFFNEYHGLTFDAFGTVATTRDAGKSWKRSKLHEFQKEHNSSRMSFHDGYGIIFLQDTNFFFRTTDSGKSWVIKYISDDPNDNISDLKLVSTNIAYCRVGTGGKSYAEQFRTLRTTDGGETWHKINIISPPQYYSTQLPGFTTPDNGWIVVTALDSDGMPLDAPMLYRTTDGGETWFDATPPGLFSENDLAMTFGNITFADDKTGWIPLFDIGNAPIGPIILKTEDGGKSWRRIIVGDSPLPMRPLSSKLPVQFIAADARNLFLQCKGRGQSTYRSTDGGDTWKDTYFYGKFLGDGIDLAGYSYPASNIAWAVGKKSTVVRFDFSVNTDVEEQSMTTQNVDLIISPNPVSDYFNVFAPDNSTVTARDVFGRVMYAGAGGAVSVSDWPQGIYFIETTDSSGRRNTAKLIVTR